MDHPYQSAISKEQTTDLLKFLMPFNEEKNDTQ